MLVWKSEYCLSVLQTGKKPPYGLRGEKELLISTFKQKLYRGAVPT